MMGMCLAGAALAGDIAESAAEVKPLAVGAAVPDVTIADAAGKTIQSVAALKDATILIVYRGGWCPYCTRHLAAVGQSADKLRAMGYQIVGVSPDKPAALAKALKATDADYRLLSDPELAFAAALGVVFKLDAATAERYDGLAKIDLTDSKGKVRPTLPVPSVFIVKDGKIVYRHVDADYRKRLSPEALLEAAKAAN